MYTSIQRRLTRARTLGLLDEIESSSQECTTGYYVTGATSGDREDLIRKQVQESDVIAEVLRSVTASKTGAVLFWGTQYKCCLIPPFPVIAGAYHPDIHTAPIQDMLRQEALISLVLIRLGQYAVATFRGETFLDHKHGTGLVHSRHKKGGSSQRRFERHREKQIEMFFTRVCQHVREKLEPHIRDMDYLFYGGERNTIAGFRKQCTFLQRFDPYVVDRILNVRRPNRSAVTATISDVWCSEVIEWTEA